MRRYLRNRLRERSTRYGLILLAAALTPPEYLDRLIATAQKFSGLLAVVGGIAALFPERKNQE